MHSFRWFGVKGMNNHLWSRKNCCVLLCSQKPSFHSQCSFPAQTIKLIVLLAFVLLNIILINWVWLYWNLYESSITHLYWRSEPAVVRSC